MKPKHQFKIPSRQELHDQYDKFEQKITNRIIDLPRNMAKKYENMTDYEWEEFLKDAYEKEQKGLIVGL